MKTLSLLFVAAFAVGVQAQDPVKKEDAKKADSRPVARNLGLAEPLVMEKDREVYGSEVTMKEGTLLAKVLNDPKAYEGKKVKITAEIESVCLKKGCWMNVKDGASKATVKFKGYKFFVPLDVDGRLTTFEAVPEVKVVSEAMRRHYAEDAGKSKEEIEKIKGDVTQVILMAEAVEINAKPAKDDCCEGEVNADGSIKKDGEKKEGAKKEGCCEGSKTEGGKTEGAKKEGCCDGAKSDGAKKEGCCGGAKKTEPEKKDS
jgi:hypothetical protein